MKQEHGCLYARTKQNLKVQFINYMVCCHMFIFFKRSLRVLDTYESVGFGTAVFMADGLRDDT